MAKVRTTKGFIEKANIIHNSTYSYSKTNYIKTSEKVIIVCNIHGDFQQRPNDHLKGRGCPSCGDICGAKIRVGNFNISKPDLSTVEKPIDSTLINVGNKGYYVIVDLEDYDDLKKVNWNKIKGGYIYNKKLGLMHRHIMECPKNMFVDHINHVVNDNRKSNLRICTHSENMKNTILKKDGMSSMYKGVGWYPSKNKWVSRISVNNTRMCLGYFTHEKDAALAYNEAAIEHHKEFAKLNII